MQTFLESETSGRAGWRGEYGEIVCVGAGLG